MMLPLMVLPLIFASCDTDDGSNPKLDLSHVSEGFVLNTPAYAENNTYDLVNSEGVWLTCSQPNYGGGVPYVVNYYVQVSLDPTFAQGNADAAYTELPSSYYLAKMQVNARELNDAVVELYQKAHPDAVTVPEKVTTYIKLRACIDGGMDKKLGETFSNVITLPSVHATYVAPDAEFKPNLFVIGSSIQEAWTSWKEVPKLAGIDGQYFTVIYVPAGGEFKWGTAEGDYKDYNALNSVTDKANAGAQANGDFNNIQFTNGGWYTLYFKGTITPDGTIKWNDAKTTVVEANKSYGWTFTPTDTANYKTLTGSIELWHKSTSSGGGSYYAPVVPDMPMLYRGCTGDAVKTLQDKLNALGYNSGNVDGIFGAKTYAAVTAFQKANSLGVDGIVGKLTWAKLYDATPVNVTPVTTQPMLRTGSRGDAVRKLQELLNALGYDCGSVDGIFGSKTYAAVLAFQKANGLGADGIVGPLTWAKLG